MLFTLVHIDVALSKDSVCLHIMGLSTFDLVLGEHWPNSRKLPGIWCIVLSITLKSLKKRGMGKTIILIGTVKDVFLNVWTKTMLVVVEWNES